MSRLDLVVGPNGSGKSTFIRKVVVPKWPAAAVVDPDAIAAHNWPEDPESHGYEAAEIAAATRARLIELSRPFVAETVFSHPSKLDLLDVARGAGYYIAMHVLLVPEELAVARVAYRKAGGGHGVPEDKIRGRYQRLWDNVAVAVTRSDSATFWDNSRFDGPVCVALFADGVVVGSPSWPPWAPAVVANR
ncbi:MAG: AAA family ATPase [Acidimicrobiales bacterium]